MTTLVSYSMQEKASERAMPGSRPVGDIPGRWWIAFIKSGFQAQRDFAADLESGSLLRGVRIYTCVPSKQQEKPRKNGKVTETVYVFGSYIPFAVADDQYRFDLEEREYRQRQRISKIIEVPPKAQAEFVTQLSHTQRAVNFAPRIEAYEYLLPGKRIIVKPGHALRGVRGVLVPARHDPESLERDNEGNVQVQVNMLGRGSLLHVDPVYLELLDDAN